MLICPLKQANFHLSHSCLSCFKWKPGSVFHWNVERNPSYKTHSLAQLSFLFCHTHKHLTLHQSVEGVYWWQVGCYGNILIPSWCLNVHSNSPWRHVTVEIGHYAGGEGHISQTTLAVIATRTGCREEEWRHISCHYFNLCTHNWTCYM